MSLSGNLRLARRGIDAWLRTGAHRVETAAGSETYVDADAYEIEVSSDAAAWTQVAAVTGGDGGTDNVAFTPVYARYVRLTRQTRATSYGFSIYQLELCSH